MTYVGNAAAAGALWRTACLLGLALLATLSVSPAALAQREPPEPPLLTRSPPSWPQPPEVSAEAWVLVDVATGQILAEHRGQQRRPVASTVKILTAMTVLDRAELDEVVEVGPEVEVGGASVGLSPGDRWTVEELLEGLLIRSGNDAAEALAVHVAGDMDTFVEQMVADAAALGLEDVVITEASGLQDGNELSARSLAHLARVALDDPELRALFARETADLPGLGTVATRNELLEEYSGATGVKTGFTAAAGLSFVGSARRDGVELLAVVLASDDDPARFEDAARLLDHGFDAYEPVTLAADGELVVAGGRRSLVAPQVTFTAPEGSEAAFDDLPPARPRAGAQELDVVVDGDVVGTVDVEIARPPAAVSGTPALGRALVDEVYAGMRATTARGRW